VPNPDTFAIEQPAPRHRGKLAAVQVQQLSLVDRVGSGAIGVLEVIGSVATFGGRAVVEAVRPPYEPREILRHVFQFGYRSAPLILIAGLAIGIVLSMHTRASLERFGAEAMIPAGLAIALIRETGPLTAGLLVAGRVGAGIGAEIGAMKVSEQIDALEASAVDAFKYLAVTRILALMIVMPLLTIMMDFAGMFGGYIAEAAVSGMSWQVYFERAFSYIAYSDIIPATLKTVVFGYLIAVVSSYLGFTTSRGTEGVGEASTRSVVMASMLIIVSDVILVKIIFFFYPSVTG
jgi:phospholipid/cholesterol/gamma-HCH transport system permease protein